MKEVATGQYEFARLREGDACVYVDKTDILAQLAMKRQDALYFIARPRRFGKSLMLTTLRCMFEGRRELFRGLKIMKTGWDWNQKYPVIMLNMQDVKSQTSEGLEANLYAEAQSIAKRYRLDIDWEKLRDSGRAFSECLRALGQKVGPYVVLVDEYDVPLQGFLGTKEIAKARTILHDFYAAFKSNVGSIRFLMMTGVSKFAKLSVFSGLNNLTDLTLDDASTATLLGYTHDELKKYFREHVAALGKNLGMTPKATYQAILSWYDSYRFSPYSESCVINPVALGLAFKNGILAPFWSKTGMPTLVMERMEAAEKRPDTLDGISATPEDLDVCDADTIPMVPLLYQAGYLTIKDVTWEVDADGDRRPLMRLGIPNKEVALTLSSQWWKTLMKMRESDFAALVHVAERQIASGDIEALVCETLYQLYAKLPPTWTPKSEQDAKRYFLLFMEMAGARMQPEKPSVRGFADAVVETEKGVWIMEFKYNRSAVSAVRQILDRGYADAWKGDSRPVTLVGIKFDSKRRNIDVPKFKKVNGR